MRFRQACFDLFYQRLGSLFRGMSRFAERGVIALQQVIFDALGKLGVEIGIVWIRLDSFGVLA